MALFSDRLLRANFCSYSLAKFIIPMTMLLESKFLCPRPRQRFTHSKFYIASPADSAVSLPDLSILAVSLNIIAALPTPSQLALFSARSKHEESRAHLRLQPRSFPQMAP